MTCYTDIDYESSPIADLDLDLHWIQLPNSVLAARRQAKQEALAQAREKSSAQGSQSIPGPRRPALLSHRRRSLARVAIGQLRDGYRGWRNPFPANFVMPSSPKAKK